ncbi:MAG: M48 family metalloprotease, partial [Planctomycetaceae bacterium]
MTDSADKPAPPRPAQAPPAALPDAPTGQPSARELLAAIPDRLEVPAANSAYSFELLAVAGLMVLLPILYLAIIVAVGWGVVWHFRHNFWFIHGDGSASPKGRGGIMLVLAYLAPGLVGLGLFITLLKPLFAGWWDGEDPRIPLDRKAQPLLFAFVDRLCDALGSPRPHAIYVDEQPNASAGLVGVSGLLNNRLQLTLGLPLVAGMPLQNLTGILAHEFGHFSQYWGMRLSGAINLVNAWLSHVVDHRDSVDEWVAETARSLDLRIGWVFYLVQFANWLVRLLLRGLRLLGVLFSRRLMWQMEFHADAYEAELAGSETFRGTFTRLGLIMAANGMAREEFGHFAQRKQLVDNFTLFTTGQIKLLKPEVRKAVRTHLSEDQAAWHETHPAPKDRIRVVEEAARPGVFTLDLPASTLFREFDTLCRSATRKHYQQVLGRPVKETELTSAEMLLDELEETSEGLAETRRFVGGEACAAHFLHAEFRKGWDPDSVARKGEAADPAPGVGTLPLAGTPPAPASLVPGTAPQAAPDVSAGPATSGGPVRSAEEWLAELREAREGQRSLLATAAEVEERMKRAVDDVVRARSLHIALKHKLDASSFQPDRGRALLKSQAEGQRFLREAQAEFEVAWREREPYVRAWSHRLWAALGLLATTESATRL